MAEQSNKMNNFFEGKLSVEEEINFLEEVSKDEELKKVFEIEMLLNNLDMLNEEEKVNTAETDAIQEFESADVHIARIKAALEEQQPLIVKKTVPDRQIPVSPKKKTLRIGLALRAAAAIIIVAIAVPLALMLYQQKSSDPEVVIKKIDTPGTVVNKPPVLPVPIDTPSTPVNKTKQQQVLATYYERKSYKHTNEDPVEVSRYLADIKRQDYDEVIQSSEDDLETRGSQGSIELQKAYLAFYRGFAYLMKNNEEKASELFKNVLDRIGPETQLHAAAEWYLAMAYLKQNKIEDAKQLLKKLSESEYKTEYKNMAVKAYKLL